MVTHQQLYRQGLLQERLHPAEGDDINRPPSVGNSDGAPGSSDEADGSTEPAAASVGSTSAKPIPPPIVTSFPDQNASELGSDWSLEVSVEGKKQCMILGFVVNIAAVKLLAGESVLSRFFVCIVVTCAYVMSIYNPRRPVSSWNVSDGTDISQCSDPQRCCLHKAPVVKVAKGCKARVPSQQAQRAGGETSGTNRPVRLPSGNFKKFAMGSTMGRSVHVESGNAGDVAHAWSTTRAETFSVRGPEYSRLRRKQVMPCLSVKLPQR